MIGSAKKTLMSLIRAEVETLAPEEGFLSDLKSTVSKLNPESRPSSNYRPSGMNCLRQMYYDKVKAPMDAIVNDYSGVRIPETGTASHEKIQYYVSKMKDCGYDCEWIDVAQYVMEQNLDYLIIKDKKAFETKLYDTRYGISFLCDGIIKYKGKYYILEIKTEAEMKGAERKGADEKHIAQASCYSLCLKIDQIMWLYEERNFCIPKCYLTTITPEMRSEIILKIETVDNAVKTGEVPEKTSLTKTCYYCVYKNFCRKQG